MPGADDRRSRPTIPFDSEKLAQESEALSPFDQDVDFELVERPTPHPRVVAHPTRMANGTTPPQGVRVTPAPPAAPDPQAEIRSRTATIHDPLTTSVLAEIARRSQESEPPAEAPHEHDEDDRTPTDRPRRR